jgi:poly(hydroxyalkanoate) granule-associated protein
VIPEEGIMAARKPKTRNGGKDIRTAELASQLEHAFLAGLGALSHPTEIGSRSFDALVKEGEKFRKKAANRTEDLINDVQVAIREMAEGAQSKATGLFEVVRDSSQVEKLNSVFDERVAGAMDRLGVPTKKDFDKLSRKLDKVLAAVESKAGPTRKKAAPKTRRKVAKKAASRKKVAGKATTRKKVARKTAAK